MIARIRSLVSSQMGCLTRLKRAEAQCLFRTAALALVVAAGVVVWAEAHLSAEDEIAEARVESLLEDLKGWPVLQAVLSEHPEAEGRLIQAMHEDLAANRSPMERESRTYGALWRLGGEHVLPRLRAADDRLVLDVWRTHARALRYVAGKSTEDCVTFLDLGLIFKDPARVDSTPVLRGFNNAVLAAYRSGRSNQERELLSTVEVVEIWEGPLRFRERHWATIATPRDVLPSTFCDTGIRMTTNLHLVEKSKRVDYARSMMGQRHL